MEAKSAENISAPAAPSGSCRTGGSCGYALRIFPRCPQRRMLLLMLGFCLLLALVYLPQSQDFKLFGLYDQGAIVKANQLYWQHGWIPTRDFGYSYGLGSLLLGGTVLPLMDYSPWGHWLLMLAGQLALVAAVWSILTYLPMTRSLWLLVFISWPLWILPNYLTYMHVYEAALLTTAISLALRQRFGWALALCTLTLFLKPSMAYLLGTLLVVVWFWHYRADGWYRPGRLLSLLAPSLIVGGLGVALLALCFGLTVTLQSLLPLTGGRSYQAMDFGFFRAGRAFWLPQLGSITEYCSYYIFSPAAWWLLCTVGLLTALLHRPALWRNTPAGRLWLLAGGVHFAFIFLLYAWAGSWIYYSWALGLVSIATLLIWHKAWPAWGLAVLALVGQLTWYASINDAWQYKPRVTTAGQLWIYQDMQTELQEIQARTPPGTLWLTNGIMERMLPNVQTPHVWFLSPELLLPADLTRLRAQIQSAPCVVTYTIYDPRQEAWNWPDLADLRTHYTPVWSNRQFTIWMPAVK